VIAAADRLASTGTNTAGLGIAAFALLAGVLLVGFRRFALRR
jgi:LPXTG-motif cell wall-anchored protein